MEDKLDYLWMAIDWTTEKLKIVPLLFPVFLVPVVCLILRVPQWIGERLSRLTKIAQGKGTLEQHFDESDEDWDCNHYKDCKQNNRRCNIFK